MTPLWTDADAVAATGGTATAPFAVTGLSIDTRSIQPGEMFVALSDRRDGHDFVAAALAAGATAALVSRRPEGVAEDAPLLIVADVMAGLQALARAARARTAAKVIGVTGSVGKTSTKEMLRHVLGRQGRVHAAEKSFNNHWGVPLTLARMPRDADFAVIEIGMNHPGEIAPLARLAEPDVAVITTVAAAHLAAFDGIEGIAAEKATILDGLRPGGRAILNGDLDTTPVLTAHAAELGVAATLFGAGVDCAARLLGLSLAGGISRATARIGSEDVAFTLATMGRHFAMNAVATLAAVAAAGGDLRRAAGDLADWTPPAGRGLVERLDLPMGTITLLDDAYNANPTSMAVALEVLAATEPRRGGRRVAILGEMLELGPTEAALHAGLAELPGLRAADTAILVGARMAALEAVLPPAQRGGFFADAAAAIAALPQLIGPGDVVLVKGSLGSRVVQIVQALRDMRVPVPTDDPRIS